MISTTNLERIVLVMTVGLCEAIRSKKLSIDEAQGILFSPFTMDVLMRRNSSVADVIHSCTELEDIQSLLPHRLLSNLDEFKEEALSLLASGHQWEFEEERWLSQLVSEDKKAE